MFGGKLCTSSWLGSVSIRTAHYKFIRNLLRIENKCRITNTIYETANKYLIASHIKPWAKCTDEEKVDGNNGLLLAPHIDHLFDRNLISFKKDGTLLVSQSIQKDKILEKWNISFSNVGAFSDKQDVYLEYHRNIFFQKNKCDS